MAFFLCYLSVGLVGYNSLAVDGYAPDSAFKLVPNMILDANRKP